MKCAQLSSVLHIMYASVKYSQVDVRRNSVRVPSVPEVLSHVFPSSSPVPSCVLLSFSPARGQTLGLMSCAYEMYQATPWRN